MWIYFYYTGCPSCDHIDGFMRSISGMYDIIFNNVREDSWGFAKSVGVTSVPTLYISGNLWEIGLWPLENIETLLSS